MSKILAAAQAHFKDVLAQGLRGPIRVPEWDNAEIWFKPSTTLAQEGKIFELQSQGKAVEALVTSLIQRALDADGKPVFQITDKPELMRSVDPTVLLRVISEINDSNNGEAREEALKN